MQQPFFYKEHLCTNIDDFICLLESIGEIDYDDLSTPFADCLEDEYIIQLGTEEPIFDITPESLCELLFDCNEDRIVEDAEHQEQEVLEALKQSIDFDKLRSLLPKNIYGDGKDSILTKKQILDYYANLKPEEQKSGTTPTDLDKFIEFYKSLGVECVVGNYGNIKIIYLMEDFDTNKLVSLKHTANNIHFTKVTFDLQGKFISQIFF